MKKNALIIFISIIFFSCTNNQTLITDITGTKSVKNEIIQIQSGINWAKEIEGNRLTENISVNNKINPSINLSPFLINIVSEEKKNYPNIEGFGNLDYSELNDLQKNRINSFINLISINIQNSNVEDFSQKYIFNFVFFKSELLKIIEEDFHIEAINNEDNNQKNNSSDENNEPKKEKKLFEKYYIGKPSFTLNNVSVPVRLFCKTNYIDVIIYMNSEENSLIYNVEIQNWSKKNG